MTEASKDYLRDFVVAVLKRAYRPLTAGDVAEHIAVLGMSEGHPAAEWQRATPIAVHGILRTLEKRALVERGSEVVRNGRSGREEPTFKPAGDAFDRSAPLPFPPEEEEPAPPVGLTPVPATPLPGAQDAALTMALLEFGDELMGSVARFLEEVRGVNSRARERLAALGYEVGR